MFGLNLTQEVKDGILNHGISHTPHTCEGAVVRLSDKIAYLTHDIDDAVRAGIISFDSIPHDVIDCLGNKNSDIVNTLVKSVIENSGSEVFMGRDEYEAMKKLRSFMFDAVYTDSAAKDEENKAKSLIKYLYKYYMDNLDKMPKEYMRIVEEQSAERAVCDYISGMSDRYCIQLGKELIIPHVWSL